MLGYWSKPYPEEILYSVIARNIDYLSTKGPKQLLPAIFGRDNISSTLDLPSGIAELSRFLNGKQEKAHELIENHTLFPYYRQVLSLKYRIKVVNSMLNKSGNIHTRVGINAGIFSALKLPRYCPVCVREDLIDRGETYFRREHQIPSLKICTVHNIYLIQFSADCQNVNKHYYLSPSKLITDNQLSLIKTNTNQSVLYFAQKICDLLKNLTALNINSDPYRYNLIIKKLGFRKGSSSLDIQSIYCSFQEIFSDSLLKHYNSPIDISDPSCWLKGIFRKHRKSFDPVRHLLIQEFLKHLSNQKQTNQRQQKYNCRNPVCKHYQTYNQTTFEIRKDSKSKRDITYVKCICGYTYTQSFIRSQNREFVRVKNFGLLWENELRKLINGGLSWRAISAILKADPKTIQNYFDKTKFKTPTSHLEKYEKQWKTLKRKNPKYTITELRRLKPGIYSFLYRNNRQWLVNQKYPNKNKELKTRVDWQQRDELLTAELKGALLLMKTQYPKRRITKSILLKLSNMDSMFRVNTKKMPISSEFLEAKTETSEEYRRRLIEAYKSMTKSKEPISYWKLLRTAGIRKKYISDNLHALTKRIISEPLYLSEIA